MNNIKQITLNQYNIVGKKIDVDFEQIKQYENLEEITIKNFEINEEQIDLINTIDTLKRLVFINCIFDTDSIPNKVENLKLVDCIKTDHLYQNDNIKRLYISDCEEIDIKKIENLQLQVLSIEKNKVLNLKQIENFYGLEYLYLQEIEIKEDIDFSKLPNLKKLNLNGSKVENREEYIQKLKKYSFEVTFEEKNLKIQ